MRAVLADDLVLDDRRLAGLGRVDGADAYLDTLAVMWELAPDRQLEPRSVLAVERHGVVAVARNFGTLPEGGAFETYGIIVATLERGRVSRFEFFEIDAADAALARLAELRPDPLLLPPNAATRASDRMREAVKSRDWQALDALCAPVCVFDDRQRTSLTTGGREMLIANLRLVAASGTRVSRTLLATSGDRLALERIRFTGADETSAFEIENLGLTEVDGDGRVVAAIVFDPDDRRAASRELLERWAHSDAAYGLPVRTRLALLDRDLDRLRAELPAGFVFHDHRRSGAGRIEGADAYVAWTATLFEASPDAIIEALYYVAVER
ncbi:MAG: hypothetical protein L0221_18360, partial [Chloroflexi bacterium]|nr:hypothetical protein [Chloroflexota bacterium]